LGETTDDYDRSEHEVMIIEKPENPGKGTNGGTSGNEKEKPFGTRTSPGTRFVERATALRGLSISRPMEPEGSDRRRTLVAIRDKDPEIPYAKLEAATRDLVCALMERQDRMNEELFYKITDLEYRLSDLETDLRSNDEEVAG
jgi:hypothetical protein